MSCAVAWQSVTACQLSGQALQLGHLPHSGVGVVNAAAAGAVSPEVQSSSELWQALTHLGAQSNDSVVLAAPVPPYSGLLLHTQLSSQGYLPAHVGW